MNTQDQQRVSTAKKYAWLIQVTLLLLSVSTIKLPNGKTVGETTAEVVAPSQPGGPPAGGQWLRDVNVNVAQFNARMLNGLGPLSAAAAASIMTLIFTCFVFLWVQKWYGSNESQKLPERVLEAAITPGIWGLAFCNPAAAIAMSIAHSWCIFTYPPPTRVFAVVMNPDGTGSIHPVVK